jgi:predicted DNA-binding transcriptional regulator AlpA
MTDQRNSAARAWRVLQQAGGIVAAADIAERLEISKARVAQLTARDDWPAPVDRIGRSPVWLWADVLAWRAAERKPGRPAKR